MRETIGGTWITQLVIIFMLLFVAFLSLSLNYTKAFRIKNELITIIEKREGLTSGSDGSIAIINNYLSKNSYYELTSCPSGSYGVTNLNSTALRYVSSGDNSKIYYYCVSKYSAPSTNYSGKVYYQVKIALKFNLPIIGDIFTFEVTGNTKDITIPGDNLNTM